MPWITPMPHRVPPSFVVGPRQFAELPDLLPYVGRIQDALSSVTNAGYDWHSYRADVGEYKPDDMTIAEFCVELSAHLGLPIEPGGTRFEDIAQRLALRSEWPWTMGEVRTEEGWEVHLWADTSYGLVCVWRGKDEGLGALAARARREVAERGGPVKMIPTA